MYKDVSQKKNRERQAKKCSPREVILEDCDSVDGLEESPTKPVVPARSIIFHVIQLWANLECALLAMILMSKRDGNFHSNCFNGICEDTECGEHVITRLIVFKIYSAVGMIVACKTVSSALISCCFLKY